MNTLRYMDYVDWSIDSRASEPQSDTMSRITAEA